MVQSSTLVQEVISLLDNHRWYRPTGSCFCESSRPVQDRKFRTTHEHRGHLAEVLVDRAFEQSRP